MVTVPTSVYGVCSRRLSVLFSHYMAAAKLGPLVSCDLWLSLINTGVVTAVFELTSEELSFTDETVIYIPIQGRITA